MGLIFSISIRLSIITSNKLELQFPYCTVAFHTLHSDFIVLAHRNMLFSYLKLYVHRLGICIENPKCAWCLDLSGVFVNLVMELTWSFQ